MNRDPTLETVSLPSELAPTGELDLQHTQSETLTNEGATNELAVLREGNRLANYVLQTELGEGGIGVVWEAFDTKLDRKVAIKLLKRRAGAHARRRFLREAQAMARLSHPNVVQVYDFDEVDGLAFIVMEFVRGVTLDQWLAAQQRSHGDIIDVFRAAGTGLAAAHARGLVHRDFKPTNVMINEEQRVLVMDFGLAREWSRTQSGTDELRAGALLDPTTSKGQLVGTPKYMSPEQLDGLETDACSDQFSFCVALWEALHGEPPFRASSMLQLMVVVRAGQVTIPDDTDVPLGLRDVLLHGMAVEPTQRWPSMQHLLDALSQQDQHATPTHRWPLWLGVALLGLTLVAANVWLWIGA